MAWRLASAKPLSEPMLALLLSWIYQSVIQTCKWITLLKSETPMKWYKKCSSENFEKEATEAKKSWFQLYSWKLICLCHCTNPEEYVQINHITKRKQRIFSRLGHEGTLLPYLLSIPARKFIPMANLLAWWLFYNIYLFLFMNITLPWSENTSSSTSRSLF